MTQVGSGFQKLQNKGRVSAAWENSTASMALKPRFPAWANKASLEKRRAAFSVRCCGKGLAGGSGNEDRLTKHPVYALLFFSCGSACYANSFMLSTKLALPCIHPSCFQSQDLKPSSFGLAGVSAEITAGYITTEAVCWTRLAMVSGRLGM